jgi:hypothetical protein
MRGFLAKDPVSAPPPTDEAALVESIVERIRRVPGVRVVWWYGQGPFFACARHCGENRVADGPTLREAMELLEDGLRATNRRTIRDAFRLL